MVGNPASKVPPFVLARLRNWRTHNFWTSVVSGQHRMAAIVDNVLMKAQPSRAISIRQPLVELILRGIKKKEYRTVPTNIRERVFLYASLRPSPRPMEWRKAHKEPGELPTG